MIMANKAHSSRLLFDATHERRLFCNNPLILSLDYYLDVSHMAHFSIFAILLKFGITIDVRNFDYHNFFVIFRLNPD